MEDRLPEGATRRFQPAQVQEIVKNVQKLDWTGQANRLLRIPFP